MVIKAFFLPFCYDLAIPFQQLTYKALFKGLSPSRNNNSSCSELIFLFLTFVLKMRVCVGVHMHNVSMEVRGQLTGLGSLSPSCVSYGLNQRLKHGVGHGNRCFHTFKYYHLLFFHS